MTSPLDTIIDSLSKEEVRFFKLFLNRTVRKNRKDLDLFDYMRKQKGNYNTKDLLKKLKTNAGNYYTIKNRLYHELNNSMVWQYIWKDNQSKSFSYVLLGRLYKNKGELDLAFHFFQKAEKEAIESDLYELLSMIYSEIIQLSHELLSINVDNFIQLKRDNMKILSEIDEIDLLLAKIMYDVKTKQNYSNSEDSLVELIKTKFNKISKQNNLLKSTRFRIRLFNMYSRLLLQKRDYKTLENFVIKSYDEFENEKLFDRSNHNDKLTILTYIANCLFKTNKNKQSLKYAELLLNSMQEYDGLLYDKYLFFYYNILVSNYSVTDKEKALNYLDKASNNEVIKKLPSYNSFIYLNRSLIYYDQDKFKKSKQNISRLIMQKDFLLLDQSFQLKILITSIIICYKNSEKNMLDKINDIKDNYSVLLKTENHLRDVKFLDLISKKIVGSDFEKDKSIFLSNISDKESKELDIIGYNNWVKINI
jgi:tetratricopeptide (TPR) repeat protein